MRSAAIRRLATTHFYEHTGHPTEAIAQFRKALELTI